MIRFTSLLGTPMALLRDRDGEIELIIYKDGDPDKIHCGVFVDADRLIGLLEQAKNLPLPWEGE
jgi:hypothetical protein